MNTLLEYWWILAFALILFMGIRRFMGDNRVDFRQKINESAMVVDVRTPKEFSAGHMKNSVNIPLNQLKNKLDDLDSERSIITVCAMGSRAEAAKKILTSAGFDAYNGGAWKNLERKAKQ